MHTYLEFETAPIEVLRRVNRNISYDLDPEMFVTLSAVELDVQQHTLRFGRAGHEPLLLVHADGKSEQLSPAGTVLGMLDIEMFDAIIAESTYTMNPGDTLVLYTDGITEALNADHEKFGYDRLIEFVQTHRQQPVDTLYQSILEEVKRFTDGMPQLDDITLVLLRREGGPEG